jgi:serine/threonine protein kinase
MFAIKAMRKAVVIEDDEVECTLIERRVLAVGSEASFCVKLHSAFQSPDRLFFVMEFVSGGDLMFHIQDRGKFKEGDAVFYGGEILLGLWFLHERGIIYRDLKLDNVMLAADGHIKIADMGMAKENILGDVKATTFCGTPDYIAPEIIEGRMYDKSVDYWALGVLLYEMLTGRSPYNGDDDDALFDDILRNRVKYPKNLSRETTSLIKGLLTSRVRERLGCGAGGTRDLKDHAFFKNVNWEALAAKQVKPPFVPATSKRDIAANFDKSFTSDKLKMTPTAKNIIKQIPQEEFADFDFVNDNF